MLLFVDSMSHYDNVLLTSKWDVRAEDPGFTGSVIQSVSSGRFGGGGITFTQPSGGLSNNHPYYIQKNFDGTDTIIVGLAVLQTTTQNVYGGRLLTFLNGSSTQVGLNIMQSGQIQAVRATTANTGVILGQTNGELTVLGLSTDSIASSSYDFLEVKVVFAISGSIEIKRNGSPFWTLSGVNTAVGGLMAASVLVGGFTSFNSGAGGNNALQAIISDFHLLNTDATADTHNPTTFIGDRHWETVVPSSDSTPIDWTPTGSGTHALNVDEIPPNTTDYNATATLNAEDALLFGALTGPSSASVLLSYTMYLQKDTGGAVGVSGLMVSPAGGGGTEGNGTEFQVPNPYAFRQSFLCTDPAAPGTNPLTVAIVNAAGHGYERTS